MGTEQTYEFERRPATLAPSTSSTSSADPRSSSCHTGPLSSVAAWATPSRGMPSAPAMASKRSGARGETEVGGATKARRSAVLSMSTIPIPHSWRIKPASEGTPPEWSQATQLPKVGCPAKDNS